MPALVPPCGRSGPQLVENDRPEGSNSWLARKVLGRPFLPGAAELACPMRRGRCGPHSAATLRDP